MRIKVHAIPQVSQEVYLEMIQTYRKIVRIRIIKKIKKNNTKNTAILFTQTHPILTFLLMCFISVHFLSFYIYLINPVPSESKLYIIMALYN